MEKINLAQFDINVDDLIKDATATKSAIDQLVQSQKALTELNQTSSEAFVENAADLRELRKEYNAQIKVLGEVNAATNRIIPLEQQLDEIRLREIRSINDLRKQNQDLTKIRNNVNIQTAQGRQQLIEINAELDKNNQLIKENVSENERNKMSVGGYADAIREAFAGTSLFGSSQKEVNETVRVSNAFFKAASTEIQVYYTQMTTADTVTKRFIGSLKLLRAAFIATGIGAVIVALGTLVAYLASTQEGIDKVNRVLTPLKTVMQAILGVAQNVGKALFDAFNNPRELLDSFLDALRPVGTVLQGIATFNWSQVKQGFSEIGESMVDAGRRTAEFFNEAWSRGKDIQDLSEQIARREADMVLMQSEQARIIKEQNMIAEDITKSLQEREIAAQKSIEASKLLLAEEQAILDLKIKQQELQNQSTATTIADERALNELRAQREDASTRALELQTTQQNKLNQIRRDSQNKAIKAQDDLLKKQNEELALFIAQQGIKARTLQEELELERQISEKKIAILDSELKQKKISQEKYNTEILSLNNDLLRRQAEISANNVFRELKDQERRVEIERSLNEHMTQQRLDSLSQQEEALREARAAYEFVRFSEGLTNEQEYADAVREINIASEDRMKQLREERKAALQEERDLDFETQMIAIQTRDQKQYEIEGEMIELRRQRDLEIARQKYTDEAMLAQAILNINAEADHAQAELAKQTDKAILDSRLSALDGIAKIVGEETALGKTAAAARTAMTTYEAAMNAFNALSGIPIVGPALGAGAAAVATAFGLRNIAKIMGTSTSVGVNTSLSLGSANAEQIMAPALQAVPPFARGGKVMGGLPIKRSNGDNVLATLKIGEVVLNESQQRALGGDSTFRAIGVPGFATGGVVGSPTVQNVIKNQIDDVFVETVSRAVRLGAQAGTATGAQKGISDLSTERHIQNISGL